MMLIAGLGNPGNEYQGTRHNIGFAVVDALAEKFGISVTKKKFRSLYGFKSDIMLLKPQTFMNLSGAAVSAALRFFKIPVENLIVIHDDIAFPLGVIRLKTTGRSGGHKGVQSVIDHLQTQDFKRLRIGIGLDKGDVTLADFVLSRFNGDEKPTVGEVINKAVELIASPQA